ncbi:hypothetical protein EMIHUDRAFT_203825 [Emiliania huxleyi CCMP1516]|uniref:Uncharacterized protein n=2 Tax=Emiliania huxleyi TaxID=2903 RepID=A0A0D3K0G6_EMIH1|nr:hypothetical protein EMIHUDRAFT_203825 [Emiliania huxleyi CCMP1516]EOD29251.1 hypothetical protein EMIHUDRAFT_203825 [Emiliania huxleyi CCMP1516]|eukprot:XP_005781680.1 hypothetical protein EMIHUDRAFT_203825 [Emiliania huxleyi CCMP1516]
MYVPRPQHACGRAPQERAPPRRCPTPSNDFHACNSGARDWLATPDCDGGGLPQCSFCSSSNATAYLRWITDVLAQKYAQRCHSFVGYSASLSTGWLPTNRPPVIEAGCFFRFVLAPPPPSPAPLLTENEAQVQVALDAAQLPFAGPAMRRNVKIFKMLGDRFFPWARVLLWADGKLQPGRVRPFDFHLTARNATGGACATFLRLPPHRYAFGKRASRLPPSSLTLALHADTVIKSARSRKSVSDSLSTVHTQLAEYRAAVPEIDAFSTAALIDSAYFVLHRLGLRAAALPPPQSQTAFRWLQAWATSLPCACGAARGARVAIAPSAQYHWYYTHALSAPGGPGSRVQPRARRHATLTTLAAS